MAGALPCTVASNAVDQDMEQRRRIRMRVHERLGELAPHVSEVERHMTALGSQLANTAAGGCAAGGMLGCCGAGDW